MGKCGVVMCDCRACQFEEQSRYRWPCTMCKDGSCYTRTSKDLQRKTESASYDLQRIRTARVEAKIK